MGNRLILAGGFVLGALPGIAPAAPDVVISELMAINTSTIQDEDGDYPDWIELYNAGSSAASLDGWHLTDDPFDLTKWTFPAVTLGPDEFLIVFASEKDRRRAGEELHTNFKLSSEGEYLALVQPDGATRVSEYDPYPPQVEDFSYGLAMNAAFASFIASGAAARTLVPANGSLGSSWTQAAFDDSSWTAGATGVGYDRNPDYLSLIATNVGPEMDNLRTSAYIRVPFTVTGASSYAGLKLRMKYDDGFIAYVNGVEVASRNAPATPAWDSAGTQNHDDSVAVIFEEIDVPGAAGLLVEGQNVLAIQGLNSSAGSSDFLILPELDAIGSGNLDRGTRIYFHQPSPGFGNLQGFPDVSGRVEFSRASGVFTGTISVSLTTPTAGAAIRYTTDGSEPRETSALYGAPVSINASTLLRARSFKSGIAPSPITSAGYVALAANVQSFTSNLPIVIIDNFGAGGIPGSGFQPAYMAIFEQIAGRSALNRQPDLATRIGMRTRGSSTAGQAKPNLAIETWDEMNVDKDVEPLGLPPESDWILGAPYSFDLALMRNDFIFELSNEIGRYASRTRFVEVYINTDGGQLANADYFGVYSFQEKIKRGHDRVDVEQLSASYDTEPLVSGGYMDKIDRLDPGDSGFSAGGQGLGNVYPKEELITPAQQTYIQGYINQFVTTLNGANFRDPVNGYRKYIDPLAWVDHHILNVLAKNVDALRLSTYFYKSRGGPFNPGPIWDFDRSMNSTDGRDDSATTWNGTGDATDYFNYPWWGRLFQDPDFWQLWRDRWQELRRGPLATSNMQAIIDGFAGELSEAQARNFQKWGLLGGRTWSGEVNLLKNWLSQRGSWIDSQFPTAPTLSSQGGPISPGFVLSITAPAGTIYYTIGGTDPRLPGGGVAGNASAYSGPITLNANARVIARASRSPTDWSGPAAATFVVSTPLLVVSEMMYHPADPPAGSPLDADDFEFLELVNAGDVPLTLAGFHIGSGIEFTFPSTDRTPLAPGDRVIIVKDLAAFASRYGTAGIRIAGEYAENLSNGGEEVVVEGPLREPILRFAYSDLWYPSTDGLGDSLVIVDAHASLDSWGDPGSWQAGSVPGGTPGEGESGSPLGGRQRAGDSNQDGSLDLSDAVSLLLRIFGGGAGPLPCDGASPSDGGNLTLLDANGDSTLNVTDAVHVLNYLFKDGPAPALGASCVRIPGCPTACSQ